MNDTFFLLAFFTSLSWYAKRTQIMLKAFASFLWLFDFINFLYPSRVHRKNWEEGGGIDCNTDMRCELSEFLLQDFFYFSFLICQCASLCVSVGRGGVMSVKILSLLLRRKLLWDPSKDLTLSVNIVGRTISRHFFLDM